MPQEALTLTPGEGWREVAPRPVGAQLIWEQQHFAYASGSDFGQISRLSRIGSMDSPFAVPAHSNKAYRYACLMQVGKSDFSELREFNLKTGEERTCLSLGLHEWIPWLLQPIPGKNMLLALLASHWKKSTVSIRHQLAFIDLNAGRLTRVKLCHDAFFPLATHMRRQEILFQGAEGLHRVRLNGEKIDSLADHQDSTGRGAGYHPFDPLVVVGGNGVRLWHLDQPMRAPEILLAQGQFPVWDGRGLGFYFCRSSCDLFYYDFKSRTEQPVAGARENRYPDSNYARPPALSVDGRFLATCFSQKVRLTGPEIAALRKKSRENRTPHDNQLFRFVHRFCIFDLEQRVYWQHPGFSRNLAWVS